jgi:hypothetical protein
LEVKNGTVIFNLEAKAGEKTVKYTGSVAVALNMIRDRSAWAGSVKLVEQE